MHPTLDPVPGHKILTVKLLSMARPKKSAAEKFSKQLPPVRCTEGEYASIQASASQASMTMTEFIRQMTVNGEVVIEENTYDFQTVDQLRRIGVNLNQIAKVANSTGEVSPALQSVCNKLDTILDQFIANL